MGTLVKPKLIGDDCFYWDPPADTPHLIYAMFWDIVKGDEFGAFEPPNGHIFTLTQNPITSCLWEHLCSDFGWQVKLGIQLAQTWIDLVDCVHPNAHYFGRTLDISPPMEYCTFANIYQVAFENWGYGGFAMIWWGDLVDWLVTAFGLESEDDLMLETLPIDISNMVLKLCSKSMNTNISFKFSSE